MKSIDSCTRVQLSSFDDHIYKNMGTQTYTAQNKDSHKSNLIGRVPVVHFPTSGQMRSQTNRYVNSSS